MAHIKVKKGLNIPIQGNPEGEVQSLPKPSLIGLDLSPFTSLRFKLLIKEGDVVSIGQPLLVDKATPGRMIVSPAAGVIREIHRGLKRVLLSIVIAVDQEEGYHDFTPFDPATITREDLVERLLTAGFFASIRQRPFNFLADPKKMPRSIFVKAVETAPFVPSPEMQLVGKEKEFQTGLSLLKKLTDGAVHLVYASHSTFKPFVEARDVLKHTVEGPHPAGNLSLHIQQIDPIHTPEDVVWTLNAHDTMRIGAFCLHGKIPMERIIGIGGPGVLPDRTGFFQARMGYPVTDLIPDRITKKPMRLISGDPLMGKQVDSSDFLGFYDYAFCAIPENTERELLHFFRLGSDKYTVSGAYLGAPANEPYPFTTSQHGERRAFIDASLYELVMPLPIATLPLIKAVQAEDFELAETLGLLEVDAEDFALPTFVCPSKIEMTSIIQQGLENYASEVLE